MIWTDLQIEQVLRASIDPIYFIETFVWMNADTGVIPFRFGKKKDEPYYYQYETLRRLMDGENVVILKNRRAGLSWIASAWIAFGVNFQRGWDAILISRTEREAVSLLKKPKFILENLAYHDADNIEQATRCPWLKNGVPSDVNNLQMFEVSHFNDDGSATIPSTVRSYSTTKHSGRGEKSRFVFVDEVQFIEEQEEVFGSVLTTAAIAGQWMMGSNAGDVGTRFHKMCLDGKMGRNKTYWYREVWPWESGITEDMIAKASEATPEAVRNQEWFLQFKQSGSSVFNATHLNACYKPLDRFPEIAKRLENYRFTVGAYGKQYYSGCDTALARITKRSTEKDWHGWTSLTEDGIQAFVYTSQEPLSSWAGMNIQDDLGQILSSPGKVCELHREWPGLVTIEEDGPGHTVLNRYQLPNDGFSDFRGISVRHNVKNRLIRQLIVAIESHSLTITDEGTYQQLLLYQFKDGTDVYGAPNGFNDDLVMALAMAWDSLMYVGPSNMTVNASTFSYSEPNRMEVIPSAVLPVNLRLTESGQRMSGLLPLPFSDIDIPDPRTMPIKGMNI